MSRVLIVDDEPVNARLLVEALSDLHQIFVATDGPRAIEIALAGGLDLILLDVVMPGMDGFEVCRRLKRDERTRAIPVIFVTAVGDVAGETRGFDEGGVDYITKPISPPVVRARVRTHVELKQARDMLETLASIDALTGIANRRRLESALDQEWRRAVRNRHPISLALLDVDHFKKYNDFYGHAQGDECLRAIARTVAGSCRRASDVAARFGGEEFVLVLPETEAGPVRELLSRLLSAVEALGIEHGGTPDSPFVTMSLGAVTLVPTADGSSGSAIQSADALLYEAKLAGRRRGVHVDLATGGKAVLFAPSSIEEKR